MEVRSLIMSNDEKSKRRVELIRKKIDQGLTLTEAYELSTLDDLDLVPWKNCEQHEQKFLYGSKCPNCFD